MKTKKLIIEKELTIFLLGLKGFEFNGDLKDFNPKTTESIRAIAAYSEAKQLLKFLKAKGLLKNE